MGKECMARLSRRLWGGTSLKTAAKEHALGCIPYTQSVLGSPGGKHCKLL